MKIFHGIICLTLVTMSLTLCGCASTDDDVYVDEEEYSSMPWATPESWEAAPSLPGLSGPGY